jgi:hypothetical protein
MTDDRPAENPPKPDNDVDTHRPKPADEAKEIEEKGEPDGGGNFA